MTKRLNDKDKLSPRERDQKQEQERTGRQKENP